MAELTRYELRWSRQADRWELRREHEARPVASFKTKADATAGGVLAAAVGAAGGSVRICDKDGRYEEERTYPRAQDPRSSRG